MEIYRLKRGLSSILISHEEHTYHPEKEDIISGLEDIGWIVLPEELSRILYRIVEYREWPESTAEPGIEYIIIPFEGNF